MQIVIHYRCDVCTQDRLSIHLWFPGIWDGIPYWIPVWQLHYRSSIHCHYSLSRQTNIGTALRRLSKRFTPLAGSNVIPLANGWELILNVDYRRPLKQSEVTQSSTSTGIVWPVEITRHFIHTWDVIAVHVASI